MSFASSFHPLGKEAAAAILKASSVFEECPRPETSASAVKENKYLKELAHDIGIIAARNNWKHIFIRLSSRSPKDAAFAKHRIENLYEAELKQVLAEEEAIGLNRDEISRMNTRLRAMYRASTFCLGVESGFDSVRLLIESQRIREDLKQFITESIEEFNVVIREFCKFDPQMEFRAFVNEGKLTALTQYNDLCYFPFVARTAGVIVEQLGKEFEANLKSKIPLSSCVLDLVFCPSRNTPELSKLAPPEIVGSNQKELEAILKSMKIVVIEVNPLAEFAGSGLFQWEKGADRNVMLGTAPFEFRYRKCVPGKGFIKANIATRWRHLVGEDDKA